MFPCVNTGYSTPPLGSNINHIACWKECIANEDVTLEPRSFHLWLRSRVWARLKTNGTLCTQHALTGPHFYNCYENNGDYLAGYHVSDSTKILLAKKKERKKEKLCFYSEISLANMYDHSLPPSGSAEVKSTPVSSFTVFASNHVCLCHICSNCYHRWTTR